MNYVLDGLGGIVTAGLLLHKRTMTILTLNLIALVVNVILNLFWIPRFGVMGAVYATFVSFMALLIAKYRFCPRELRALPGWRETLTAIALGLLSLGVCVLHQHIRHYVALRTSRRNGGNDDLHVRSTGTRVG